MPAPHLLVRLALPLMAVLMTTACQSPAPGTPAGTTVTGAITQGASPVAQAPIVLMTGTGKNRKEMGRVTTDAQGRFRFDAVTPGTYNVVFNRPVPVSRSYDSYNDSSTYNSFQAYEDAYYAPYPDPGPLPVDFMATQSLKTQAETTDTDTFGYLESAPFTIGTMDRTTSLEPINVAWMPALTATAKTFTWKSAPQATAYAVFVASSDKKVVYTQSGMGPSATSLAWDGKDLTGKALPAGDYSWWVAVALPNGAKGGAQPVPLAL